MCFDKFCFDIDCFNTISSFLIVLIYLFLKLFNRINNYFLITIGNFNFIFDIFNCFISIILILVRILVEKANRFEKKPKLVKRFDIKYFLEGFA